MLLKLSTPTTTLSVPHFVDPRFSYISEDARMGSGSALKRLGTGNMCTQAQPPLSPSDLYTRLYRSEGGLRRSPELVSALFRWKTG
jgi:hypothetical protein